MPDAKKTTRRKRPSRSKEGAKPKQAFMVHADGTDEDIAGRLAKVVPDWDKLDKREKAETIRLMRLFWELPISPVVEAGADAIGPPETYNVTLWALRNIETMASNSMDFGNERLTEIFIYLRRTLDRDPTTSELSAALAFVRGAEAKDTVQSSLAIQMYATHDAAMRALGKMNGARYAEQAQLFGNLGAKLLNAYARQAETLAKLQRGGEQVIKHIHIDNRGGQAVVTDQVVTGGQNEKVGEQPHGQSSLSPALPCQDPQGNGVPVSGDIGQEAMQAAWGLVSGSA